MSGSDFEHERLFEAPQTQLVQANYDAFHAEGGRAYRMAQHKFGYYLYGQQEAERGHTDWLDRARYCLNEVLVTVVPIDESVIFEGADPGQKAINIHFETPVPSIPSWPNAFVSEHFIFDAKRHDGREWIPEAFDYSLGINEYTPNGRPIHDRNLTAVMREMLPAIGQQVTDWEQLKRQLGSSLDLIVANKLDRIRRVFPDELAPFKDECSPRHFCGRLALLREASLVEEVGCEPNPYCRDNWPLVPDVNSD